MGYQAYRLDNSDAAGIPAYWAAHPVIAVEAGTRLELPEGTVLEIFHSDGNRYGARGDRIEWSSDNQIVREMSVFDPGAGRNDKVFAVNLADGWCRLTTPRGLELRYEFELERVPYLGLWLNQNGLPRERPIACLAVEPCLGYPDEVGVAIERKTAAILGPAESREPAPSRCPPKIVPG